MINNKYLAEFVGTALLMMVITGSGIMGYDLSRGNLGIALLINCIATGIALFMATFPNSWKVFYQQLMVIMAFWATISSQILNYV